jgi:uncharacterized repeat protein (TIGR01451 family)
VNPEPPRWHVYVLRNPDGKLYIGQTGDVSRRIQQHNEHRSIWTKRKGPWQLLWLSESLPASTARKLEMKLKRQKGGDGFYRITGLPRPGASAVSSAAHRSAEFRRRCRLAGIQGVSLHSYRHAWAQRAKACGYPQRFAKEALGHGSRAIHEAYARGGVVVCPPIEQYESNGCEEHLCSGLRPRCNSIPRFTFHLGGLTKFFSVVRKCTPMNDPRPCLARSTSIIVASFVLAVFPAHHVRSQTPTPTAPPNADLALTVAVDKDPVFVGNNRIYTLTVENNGPSNATNSTLQVTLPPHEIFQNGSCEGGQCFLSGSEFSQSVNVSFFGDITPGAPRRVFITARVQTRFTGTFTASVSTNTSDPNLQNNTTSYTTVGPPPATAKLLNISTRLGVQTGDNALIAGFILIRNSKNVVVRALGPSLSSFGVPGTLQDPTLELHASGSGLLHANDNWRNDSSSGELQNLSLAPNDDRESAFKQFLGVGAAQSAAFTAVVSGKNNSTGVGLVEVYDLDRFEDARFGNISTRGAVGTGDNVMIGGFILGGGNGTAALLLRAIGPSLNTIPNRLNNPMLELYDGQGSQIANNDNWKDQQEDDIRATGIPPSDDLESGILLTLPSGNYTAILRGINGATGIAVVEAYNLQ